jgi:uncharacterized protein
MKLGFDVDDTLIDLRQHAFHIYNKKLNKEIGLDVFEALSTMEIHEPFGLTQSEGKAMWAKWREEIYFTSCPPFPGAVEALQELVRNGHEIYYITARPKEHCEQTKKWLSDNGFPIQTNHFYCGMSDSDKVHIIRELGLEYYFDDKPAVLHTLSELPLKIYAKDRSYNRHLDVPRITSWAELKEIVNR